MIDSEGEENNEEVAQTLGVKNNFNNSKLVEVESNISRVVDDDTVNVLKHSTRRNISDNTRKKKLRHVS